MSACPVRLAQRERVSGLIRLTKRRACSSQVDRERARDLIERKRA